MASTFARTMAVVATAWSMVAAAAAQQTPTWLMPDILDAAKAEGSVTLYSSINEGELLPAWKVFEDATGVKVQIVRASDAQLNSRIAIEARSRQKSWDLLITTAASQLPPELLAAYDVPETTSLIAQARAKNRTWYGSSANYNTPAYNTKLVRKEDLPTSYEGFVAKKEWKGRVAIDTGDGQWLAGMFAFYGEEKGRRLIRDIVAALDPVITDGHLALARALGAGEHMVALNNFMNLTLNVQIAGAPTDIFPLEPVSFHMVQVAISASAPHPNAARLAANYAISRQMQQMAAKSGRIPVRGDVETTPPHALDRLAGRTLVPTAFGPEEDRKWKRTFDELFRPR
jgi:iron(III) transport system substrate-binding protein